jgi:hypothetical protein
MVDKSITSSLEKWFEDVQTDSRTGRVKQGDISDFVSVNESL